MQSTGGGEGHRSKDPSKQKHKDPRQNGHGINWWLGSGKMKTFSTNCFDFLYEA